MIEDIKEKGWKKIILYGSYKKSLVNGSYKM